MLLQSLILTSITIGWAWGGRHHHSHPPFHLRHFRVSSPGACQEEAHHSHQIHLGSNGGCETLSLRGDRCIEILRNDCTFEFYSGDQCRGDVVSPNQGVYVGSVKVKKCPGGDTEFRWGWKWRAKNGEWYRPNFNSIRFEDNYRPRGRPHHHDKSKLEDKEKLWYWE